MGAGTKRRSEETCDRGESGPRVCRLCKGRTAMDVRRAIALSPCRRVSRGPSCSSPEPRNRLSAKPGSQLARWACNIGRFHCPDGGRTPPYQTKRTRTEPGILTGCPHEGLAQLLQPWLFLSPILRHRPLLANGERSPAAPH